jgi:hypothetical protein
VAFLIGETTGCPSAGETGPIDDAGDPSDESFDERRAMGAVDIFGDIVDVGGGAMCEAETMTGGGMTAFPEGIVIDVEESEVRTKGGAFAAVLVPLAMARAMNSLDERRGESGVGETDGDFDF